MKDMQEAGNSLNDFLDRVRTSFYRVFPSDETGGYYVVDIWEDRLVAVDNRTQRKYQVGFVEDDDRNLVFDQVDEWQEVELTYSNVATMESYGKVTRQPPLRIPLSEVDMNEESGLIKGVIIAEGLSANNNYYTLDALRNTGHLFEGKPIFVDHPSKTEQRDRPERSVRDIAGVIRSTEMGYNKEGKNALRFTGYISKAEPELRTKIAEGLVGDLSIMAFGTGKRDPKSGVFMVEAFTDAFSVDLVTFAAAGGEVETLFESVQTEEVVEETVEESNTQELRAMLESVRDENTRLVHMLRTQDAKVTIKDVLEESTKGLPEATISWMRQEVEAIQEAYADQDDMTLDQLKEAVVEIVKKHRDYLAKVVPAGRQTGGNTQPEEDAGDVDLTEAFSSLPGLDGEALKVAVAGRSR